MVDEIDSDCLHTANSGGTTSIQSWDLAGEITGGISGPAVDIIKENFTAPLMLAATFGGIGTLSSFRGLLAGFRNSDPRPALFGLEVLDETEVTTAVSVDDVIDITVAKAKVLGLLDAMETEAVITVTEEQLAEEAVADAAEGLGIALGGDDFDL